MAHIKRIDLTRDVEAHAEAYRKAIENVCKETAFPAENMQMPLTKSLPPMWEANLPVVSTTVPPLCIWQCWHWA